MTEEKDKTKEQLIAELRDSRLRVLELEASIPAPVTSATSPHEIDRLSVSHRLVDRAADMLYRMSLPDGRYEYVSPASINVFGYSPEEFYASPIKIRECIHPDWQDYFKQEWNNLLRGEISPFYEYQIIHKSGEARWLRQHNVAEKNDLGEIIAIEGIVSDITKLKKAEEALKESEERFRNIAESMTDWIWETDANAVYTYCSSNVESVLGYRADEIIGKTPFDLMPPDEAERVGAIFSEIGRGKRPFRDMENWNLTKDGRSVCLRTSGTPIFGDDNEVLGYRGVDTDITDRKQAEEALREGERKYRTLFEQVGDYILVLDLSHKDDPVIIQANVSACQIHGFSMEEMVGKPISELDTGLDEDRFKETLRRLMSGEHVIFETTHRRKDGSIFPVEVSVKLIEQDGEIPLAVSVERDITERKEAEDTLLSERAFIEAALNASSDTFFVFDPATRKPIRWNQVFREVSGYSDTEIADMNAPDDFYDAEDIETAHEGLRILADEGFARVELPLLTKDSKKILYEYAVTMIDMQDITSPLVCSVGRDITERKRMENALRENDVLIRSVLDNLPIGIAVNSADSSVVFDYMNENFLKYYRTTREALADPDAFWDSVYEEPEFRKDMKKRVLDDCVSGDPKRMYWVDVPITRTGKKTAFITARNIPIPDKQLMISTVWDVTERINSEEERRSLEAQVQHSQKLESLGVLAGGIAHDFNNLLMAILGNADIALDDLSPVAPARDNINEILKASKKAAALTKQMLAYSGKGHFIIKTLNLTETVEEMAHLLDSSTSKKALLRLDLQHDLPAIEADVAQMQQLFMNLIINASEAIGDENGLVTVSTTIKECSDEFLQKSRLPEKPPSGKYVSFEVTDTGCGMDDEAMEKLFDPFFTTKFTGRGLGLSAILGIARGHNGAIMVDSKVGEGTSITVLFPALEEQAERSEEVGLLHGAQQWKGTGIILLVDDEENVRAVGRAMLERMGFSVLTANDGQDAVEVFQKRKDEITCVVLDLMMPRMGGCEAFDNMREIRDDIPVMISSGYGEEDVIAQFSGKKPAGAIQKPYTSADLRAKMSQVLEKG